MPRRIHGSLVHVLAGDDGLEHLPLGYVAKALYKRGILVKAMSIHSIKPVRRVSIEGSGEALLPITVANRGRGISILFNAEARPSDWLETWLCIDANVDGTIYVDGGIAQGYDPMHRCLPLEPGAHRVALRLGWRRRSGEVPGEIRVERIRVIEVMPWTRRLGLYTQTLAQLALELDSRGYREAAADIVDLLDRVLPKTRLWPLDPARVLVYVEELAGDPMLHGAYPLYDELARMAREGSLSADAGYRPLENPRLLEEESRRLVGELEEGLRRLSMKYGKLGVVYAVSYGHIDLAWLWGYRESREKVVRTLANALAVHRRYPELRFVESSSLYFRWACEEDRGLCNAVYNAVSSGWMDFVGGMVVEPDVMMPLGETIVRQLLYGQRMFESMFGRKADIAWLPDSFGFPGSLPQILVKAGIRAFFTHKPEWSRFNRFPYTTFVWRGIDGSEVIAHIIRVSYSIDPSPRSLLEVARRAGYRCALLVYGYCDGGGGPSYDMMERLRILSIAPITPHVRHSLPREFLEGLETRGLPVWTGDIDVEIHRGVYTANTRLKTAIRDAEVLALDAEAAGALSAVYGGSSPSPPGYSLWEPILKAVFHDVITGSCNHEAEGEAVSELRSSMDAASALLGLHGHGKEPLLASLTQWPRRDVVTLRASQGVLEALRGVDEAAVQRAGDNVVVEVYMPGPSLSPLARAARPARGRLVVSASGGGVAIENEFYRLVLDSSGRIASLYSRAIGRELFSRPSNTLTVYHDLPDTWDAWDVSEDYERWEAGSIALAGPRILEEGPVRARVAYEGSYGGSRVSVEYIVYRSLPRIDIVYRLSWRERNTLVKTWFYPSISACEALYSIPYGVSRRPVSENTSWDRARYESLLHGWLALCDGGGCLGFISRIPRGVAVRAGGVGVSILKTSMQPNPVADAGDVSVTLSLVAVDKPADLWREYYMVLRPIRLLRGETVPIPERLLGKPLVTVEPENVILEALKVSEDGEAIIIRLFEAGGRSSLARVCFAEPVIEECKEASLLEEPLEQGSARCDSRCIEVGIGPFEIKTIRVRIRRL